jgi:hypothetical protein
VFYLLLIGVVVGLAVACAGLVVLVLGRLDLGDRPIQGGLARVFAVALTLTGAILIFLAWGLLHGSWTESSLLVKFVLAYWRALLAVCIGTTTSVLAYAAARRRDGELAGWAAISLFFLALIAIPPAMMERAVFSLTGDRRFRP